MATLVYSEKCKYSIEIIKFIHENPILGRIVGFHDISQGVPRNVDRVPTLITSQGNYILGGDIKNWLFQMLPQPEIESIGPGIAIAGYDNIADECSGRGNLFDFDEYGRPLQPMMTPDLESKISMSVQDAFKREKRD